MRVYVETNFILEMAFAQTQSAACDTILRLAEQQAISLAIPAFSFTEPHERFRRQKQGRGRLQEQIATELREFGRSSRFTDEQSKAWSTVQGLLVSSTQEAEQRFDTIRGRMLRAAQILPLTSEVIDAGVQGQALYGFEFPDSLVFASVLIDLKSNPRESCFLNSNSKDFDEPTVINDLKTLRCKPLWKFDSGLSYIQSSLQKNTE